MCIIIMIGQVYEAFVQGTYMEVLPSYIGLPLFLIVWLGFHLVKRDRALIEAEIGNFTVIEHDQVIFGCAAMYAFPEERMAEMACLAVNPTVQSQGDGERLVQRTAQRGREGRGGLRTHGEGAAPESRAGQVLAPRVGRDDGAVPPHHQQGDAVLLRVVPRRLGVAGEGEEDPVAPRHPPGVAHQARQVLGPHGGEAGPHLGHGARGDDVDARVDSAVHDGRVPESVPAHPIGRGVLGGPRGSGSTHILLDSIVRVRLSRA